MCLKSKIVRTTPTKHHLDPADHADHTDQSIQQYLDNETGIYLYEV